VTRRIKTADVDATAQAAADAGIEPDVDATVASYAEYQVRLANWKTSVDGLMSGLSKASHFEAAELTGRNGSRRDVADDLAVSRKSNSAKGRRRARAGKRGGRKHRSGLNQLQRYRRHDEEQDQDEFAGVLVGFGRHLRVTASRKYRYFRALLNKHAAAQHKQKQLDTNDDASNQCGT
jgi:hypothetical protein